MPVCIPMREKKKTVDLSWWESGGGVEGVEVVIRLQGVKKLFEKYIRPWD